MMEDKINKVRNFFSHLIMLLYVASAFLATILGCLKIQDTWKVPSQTDAIIKVMVIVAAMAFFYLLKNYINDTYTVKQPSNGR